MIEYKIADKYLIHIPQKLSKFLTTFFTEKEIIAGLRCSEEKYADNRYITFQKEFDGYPYEDKFYRIGKFIVSFQIPRIALVDLTKVNKYDPSKWNDTKEAIPPSGELMRVHYKQHDSCHEHFECLVYSADVNAWFEPEEFERRHVDYCDFRTTDSQCEFIKFRPWND